MLSFLHKMQEHDYFNLNTISNSHRIKNVTAMYPDLIYSSKLNILVNTHLSGIVSALNTSFVKKFLHGRKYHWPVYSYANYVL